MKSISYFLSSAICILFLISGCQQNTETETIQKSEPVKQAVSLQLQWFTQCQFAGYYVALEKGWYSDENIELTIHPGGPDVVPIDMVTAGSSQFGTTLLADLAVSIQKGKPAISIAQIQQNNGLRLLAKKKTGIATAADFVGKKVGVWLGGWEVQFNALMAQKNIPIDKVNVISQGFSMTPFVEDQLDIASAMIYNEYHVVLTSGIGIEELNIIDYANYGLDFPGDVLFTSQKLLQKDPGLCLGMLRASLKGWKYAMEHPSEAVDIVLKHDRSGVQTPEHQAKMMTEITKLIKVGEKKIGYTDPKTLEKMLALLVKYNMLEEDVDPSKIYTNQILMMMKERFTKGNLNAGKFH